MIQDESIGVAHAVVATLCTSTGAVLVCWAGALSPVEVTGPCPLRGDALAVGAAVTFAAYSLLGGRERSRLPLLTYAGGVYLIAGVTIIPFARHLVRPSLPLGALAAAGGMASVPSAIGDTLYNAAMRRLHPSNPNLIATPEVTLGILLASMLIGEPLTWNAAAGAALTLLGIAFVLGEGSRRPSSLPPCSCQWWHLSRINIGTR
jgi:drug/metabolite transporter (DMT)-like permease